MGEFLSKSELVDGVSLEVPLYLVDHLVLTSCSWVFAILKVIDSSHVVGCSSPRCLTGIDSH